MGHWGGNCGPGWVLHWMSLFRNTEALNKHLCPSHLWKCPVLFLFAERTCWPQTEAASDHKPPLNRVRLCQSIPFQLNSGKALSFVALRKKMYSTISLTHTGSFQQVVSRRKTGQCLVCLSPEFCRIGTPTTFYTFSAPCFFIQYLSTIKTWIKI